MEIEVEVEDDAEDVDVDVDVDVFDNEIFVVYFFFKINRQFIFFYIIEFLCVLFF